MTTGDLTSRQIPLYCHFPYASRTLTLSALTPTHSTAGTVTARSIYAEVKAFEQRSGIADENTYWLIFELLWRDYMKVYALKHGRDMFMLGGVQGEVGRY